MAFKLDRLGRCAYTSMLLAILLWTILFIFCEKKINFLIVLGLSNIASFVARINVCANRALAHRQAYIYKWQLAPERESEVSKAVTV